MKNRYYFIFVIMTFISACQSSNDKLIESVNTMNIDLFNEAINNEANLNLMVDSIPILHYAIMNSKIQMAELLIGSGADLNVLNKDSLTAIDLAVDKNNQRLIKGLIENGAKLSNERIKSSKSIDRSQSLEVFQLLESNGVNPDLTTLISIISNDRDRICNYLIFEKNFSIYKKDSNEISAIDAIGRYTSPKCKKLVLKKDRLIKEMAERERKRKEQYMKLLMF